MKTFNVKIKGVTPYMQHRMDDVKLEQWVKQRGPLYERYDISQPEVLADFYSYIHFNGTPQYYIPSDHLRMAMIEAGKLVRGKVGGATKTMTNVVAAMFMVNPDHIPMPKWDVIDKRSAVNRHIKGRVVVVRPRWNDWSVNFTLTVDEDSIQNDMIEKILTNAGKYIGIGSYRPQNKGLFGRFTIENFAQV